MKKTFSLVFYFLIVLTSCKITHTALAGKYVNEPFGDTLEVFPNKRYEYVEVLNNGNSGWTKGKWEIRKNKVHFICDTKPLVGFKERVIADSTIKRFQIDLLLGETKKPIYIEDVKIYKKDSILGDESFRKSGNVIDILRTDYDSIVVITFNFVHLLFSNKLNHQYRNIIKIFPAERLYELDKVPYKMSKNALKSTKTERYEDVYLSFKKLPKE
ncbi:MAG TPA: hypothetical protein VKR53_10175 [Puia sp.]|nr:hypothetical protein [Puia sp.]